MRKRRIPTLILLIVIMTALCSCGNAGEKTVSENRAINEDMEETGASAWVVSQEIVLPDTGSCEKSMDIPEGGWVVELLCTLSGEDIYRFVSVAEGTEKEVYFDTAYYIMKLEPPYEEWTIVDSITPEEWVEGDTCFVWTSAWTSVIQEDGQLFTILQGSEDTYLCQWTEKTGHSVKKLNDFLELGSEDANNVTAMYVDKNQRFYLLNGTGGFMGSASQNLVRMSTGTNTVLQIVNNPFSSAGQKLYQAGNALKGGFFLQAEGSKQPQFASDAVSMESGDIVLWSSGTEGYLCQREEVWKFARGAQEISGIMELSYQGKRFDCLLGASALEDGSVKLLAKAGDKYILLRINEDMRQNEKVRLELATDVADNCLKQAVDRFNHLSSEYYVEIREPEGNMTYADFRTRIQAELSAGEGPDLITAGLFIDHKVEPTAEKNLLLNLTEFLGEEEERILKNVWEGGKVGEELYAIPYAFMIQTLVANKNMIGGDRTGWTAEELMQCVLESDVQQFCSGFDSQTLFWHLCGGSGMNTDIIDWDNGVCHFDSESAEKLLEFSAQYGGTTDYLMGDVKLLEGDALTATIYLVSPSVFNEYLTMFEYDQVYIGYPTADGESGHMLKTEMVGISQNTEHVEGALAFLEYLISDDMQEYIAKCLGSSALTIIVNFPAGRDAMESIYTYLLNNSSKEEAEESIVYEYGSAIWVGGGEYMFTPLPFTEDSVEQMRTVIETAKPGPTGTEEIFDIIWEETEAYFAGVKDADEVLLILQNRIQLYFDERN